MDPSYNDSFGSFAQPTAVLSDDKGKKRWVIVAIVFVILALVAIIAAVFIGGGKFKTGFTPEEKYLNYIVNGNADDNTDVGTEYTLTKNYVFISAVYLDEYQVAYFDKAIELLNDTKLDKASLEYAEQKAMLEMFKTYKSLSELGAGGIAEYYVSDGAQGVNSGILDSINKLDGNMNRFINIYRSDAINYVNGIVQVVDSMRANGCEFKVDEQCSTTEEINSISMKNTELFSDIKGDIEKSIPVFLDLAYNAVGVRNE